MTRTIVPIVLALSVLAPSRGLAEGDLVLVLAEDGSTWRDRLVDRYGMSVDVGPEPRGATQLARDADAQEIARARGATHAVWLEGSEMRAVAANGQRARSMELVSGEDALARTALLLVRDRLPPRFAEVSDYDRERVEPGARLAAAPPDEDGDGVYAGVYSLALLIAGGDGPTGGGGMRAAIGYHFRPYLDIGAYGDVAVTEAVDDAALFARVCGEVTIGYPWSNFGLHFSGHFCGGYASVPGWNSGSAIWTAGAALSISGVVARHVQLWGRAEMDAMLGATDEACVVPALVVGATFD